MSLLFVNGSFPSSPSPSFCPSPKYRQTCCPTVLLLYPYYAFCRLATPPCRSRHSDTSMCLLHVSCCFGTPLGIWLALPASPRPFAPIQNGRRNILPDSTDTTLLHGTDPHWNAQNNTRHFETPLIPSHASSRWRTCQSTNPHRCRPPVRRPSSSTPLGASSIHRFPNIWGSEWKMESGRACSLHTSSSAIRVAVLQNSPFTASSQLMVYWSLWVFQCAIGLLSVLIFWLILDFLFFPVLSSVPPHTPPLVRCACVPRMSLCSRYSKIALF